MKIAGWLKRCLIRRATMGWKFVGKGAGVGRMEMWIFAPGCRHRYDYKWCEECTCAHPSRYHCNVYGIRIRDSDNAICDFCVVCQTSIILPCKNWFFCTIQACVTSTLPPWISATCWERKRRSNSHRGDWRTFAVVIGVFVCNCIQSWITWL